MSSFMDNPQVFQNVVVSVFLRSNKRLRDTQICRFLTNNSKLYAHYKLFFNHICLLDMRGGNISFWELIKNVTLFTNALTNNEVNLKWQKKEVYFCNGNIKVGSLCRKFPWGKFCRSCLEFPNQNWHQNTFVGLQFWNLVVFSFHSNGLGSYLTTSHIIW